MDLTIQYDAKELENSNYVNQRITSFEGKTTASKNEELSFVIPNSVINLSRSFLKVRVIIPTIPEMYVYFRENTVPISSLRLYSRNSGKYLCDIDTRFSDYFESITNTETNTDELNQGGIQEPLKTSKVDDLYYPWQPLKGKAKPFFEREVLTRYEDGPNVNRDIIIPLNLIKGSIFELNKSLLFNEELILKIRLGLPRDIYYLSNETPTGDPYDPEAGQNDAGFTYSGIYLYLAKEKNSKVIEHLNRKISSPRGFDITIPYPTIFENTASSTNQVLQIKMNASHGDVLRKIQTLCYSSANATSNLRYDHHNYGNKLIEYHTEINGERTTDFNIRYDDDTDWMKVRHRLSATPLYNAELYSNSYFVEDGFLNNQDKESDMKTRDTNVISGLSLKKGVAYDFYATTTNNAFRYLTFAFGTKTLNISYRGLDLI